MPTVQCLAVMEKPNCPKELFRQLSNQNIFWSFSEFLTVFFLETFQTVFRYFLQIVQLNRVNESDKKKMEFLSAVGRDALNHFIQNVSSCISLMQFSNSYHS